MFNYLRVIFYTAALFCAAESSLATTTTTDTHNTTTAGDFVVIDAQGSKHPSLQVAAKADVKVNGLLIYTTLTQRFYNPLTEFVEGSYQFPLPSTASVDSLQIKIGSRVIIGEVKEKQAAQRSYEKAKNKGQRTALLQQNRPNLFKIDVANISPGEKIDVTLSYVDKVSYNDGTYGLTLPTTYTPRYNPRGADDPITDQSFRSPNNTSVNNPIELNLTLNTGFDVTELKSNSHAIAVTGGREKHVQFINRFEPMNADFNLSWQQNNRTVASSLYVETKDHEHYGMLTIAAQPSAFKQPTLPKETIFVIDTSGSMGGESIAQARAALVQGLSFLSPDDYFNVIEFNSTHTLLSDNSLPANKQNIGIASHFVSNLKADGGTEMVPPVIEALSLPAKKPDVMRQVILITDGAISNEVELSQSVNLLLGDTRLFAIAIGSAPNESLFRSLAKNGRGSFVKINDTSAVSEQMKSLFNKIAKPAMKNLEIIDNNGSIISLQPESLPDVYYGEPLTVSLKLAHTNPRLRLRGIQADQSFDRIIEYAPSNVSGVAKLWAKERIEDLNDRVRLGQGDPSLLKQSIVALSIKHNVLTPYTSFIAIDHQVARSPSDKLTRKLVPNLTPKGLAVPQTSLGITLLALLSVLCLLVGSAVLIQSQRDDR